MYANLTTRQQEVFEFVKSTISASGCSPTFREIQERFNFKSPTGASGHIGLLIKKGFLAKNPMKSRAITLVVPEGCCKACGRPL